VSLRRGFFSLGGTGQVHPLEVLDPRAIPSLTLVPGLNRWHGIPELRTRVNRIRFTKIGSPPRGNETKIVAILAGHVQSLLSPIPTAWCDEFSSYTLDVPPSDNYTLMFHNPRLYPVLIYGWLECDYLPSTEESDLP